MPVATPGPLDALAEAKERMSGKVDVMRRQLVVMRIWVAIVSLIAIVGLLGL